MIKQGENPVFSALKRQGKLGFGSRFLESHGFLGAKAGHSDQRFCRWKLLFYQQPCAKKLKNSAFAEFWDCLPDFLWRNLVGVSSCRTGCILNREGLCVKELNLLLQLPQDVSTRYRSVDMTVLAAFAIRFCQRHCVSLCKGKKLKNSAKQNSWRVCRFSLWDSEGCFRSQRKLNP